MHAGLMLTVSTSSWRSNRRLAARGRVQDGAQVRMLRGSERHTRHKKARVRRAWDARLEAGRVQRNILVSEQRAHSIGLAAAAVLVAPLVRVLSIAISSTMCAASENTAAVTMPARWWER